MFFVEGHRGGGEWGRNNIAVIIIDFIYTCSYLNEFL